jgi:hypothetical protein
LRKFEGGPPAGLTKLHLRLAEVMAHGIERELPHFPEIVPNEPLPLETAAFVCRMRLRDARELMKTTIFRSALSKEIASLRDGSKARAMH